MSTSPEVLHFVFCHQRDDVSKTFPSRQIEMFNFKTATPALSRFLHYYGYKTALDA